MDSSRTILAIALSFIILLAYQHFFVKPPPETPQPQETPTAGQQAKETPTQIAPPTAQSLPAAQPMPTPPVPAAPAREGKDIRIDTNLFTAVITETGGGIKSFKLKKYNQTLAPDSEPVELITTEMAPELPLYSNNQTTND